MKKNKGKQTKTTNGRSDGQTVFIFVFIDVKLVYFYILYVNKSNYEKNRIF